MREAFDDIMADLPDAVLSAVSVATFITMLAVFVMIGCGA